MEFKPLNENVLIKTTDAEKTNNGVYLGETKNKPKSAIILEFSDKCENKNLEVGKNVLVGRCEMIPNADKSDEFFVSEKAILAIEK